MCWSARLSGRPAAAAADRAGAIWDCSGLAGRLLPFPVPPDFPSLKNRSRSLHVVQRMIRLGPLFLALSLGVSVTAQNVTLQQVVSGLNLPVAMAHAGDTRLFIVQQDGRIVIWDGTSLLPAPFLDIRTLTAAGGERGLL